MSVLTIAVWIYLETPCDAIGKESWRVDRLLRVAELREVTQAEFAASVLRDNITWEVRLDLVRCETIDRALIQVSNLLYQIIAFLDKLTLWFLI